MGEQHGPPVSTHAYIHDRAIGAGVVRFGVERRESSVSILTTRAPAPRCGIAEFARSLDCVRSRSSHRARCNDLDFGLQVVAFVRVLLMLCSADR
jgi:hypothetical protein